MILQLASMLLAASIDPRIHLVELQGAGEQLRALDEANCLADADPARARVLGLDFLRVDASTRVYHDLNPRMNGAAGLLAEIVADAQPELASALPAVLLSQPRLAGEVPALEHALAAAVATRPRWRWFLAATLAAPRTIDTVPPAGRWHIAPRGPVLRWCGPDGALDHEHASLAVTLVAGVTLAAGDRVVLGDLSCTPTLGRALLAAHGERTAALLLAAMFHATCPKEQAWT